MNIKPEDTLQYPPQNPIRLGEYYTRHVNAMTVEALHSKSDIAEQLAWRDQEIDRLKQLLLRLKIPQDLLDDLRILTRAPGHRSNMHEALINAVRRLLKGVE